MRDGERTWHRTGDAGRIDGAGRLWLMGRVQQRVERDGVIHWPLPVELAALAVPGVRHAAYVSVSPVGTARTRSTPASEEVDRPRAVLCIERSARAPDVAGEAALHAAVAPAPLDRIVTMERIPRDPRHASKTDIPTLLRRLAERGARSLLS